MRKKIKLLTELVGPGQKKKIVLIILMMIVSAMLETLGVSMIVPVVSLVVEPDIMTSNELVAKICSACNISSTQELTIVLLGLLIVLFVGKNLFLLLLYYVQSKFVYGNLYQTQKNLVHTFLHKPYAYYLGINSSEIVHLISMETVGAFTALQYSMELCTEVVVGTTLAIVVFIMDPTMCLALGILLAILMCIISKAIKPRLKKYGAAHVKYDTAGTKWLMQFASGIKEIKIAESEDFFEEQYSYNNKIDKKMEQNRNVSRNIPRIMIESVSIAGVLAIFIIRILMGNDITEMLPQLSAFGVAAVRLLPCANRVSAYLNEIAYNTPPLLRTVEHMHMFAQLQEEEQKEQNVRCFSDSAITFQPKEKIELNDIVFKYDGGDKHVLNHANMEVPIGKSVGIIGTSGSGKTTAVDLMLGLLTPESGQVLVDGVDIQKNYHDWLTHLSYIPQTIYLLDDTIRANIEFGYSKDDNDESCWKALREAQLEEFVRSLPDGLDTEIGERGVRLSGGQRQRIGIARALYTDPEILIFDEATSALDNETEEALMEAINSLHGKKTLIIIAHRLQTIKNCDIVYKVSEGKVIEDERSE